MGWRGTASVRKLFFGLECNTNFVQPLHNLIFSTWKQWPQGPGSSFVLLFPAMMGAEAAPDAALAANGNRMGLPEQARQERCA